MSKDLRQRNWTFEVYPDSAPEDWRDILLYDLLLPFVVSPLHDKDKYDNPRKLPEGKKLGDFKKPHYHVMVCFEGKKSFEQIKEITDLLRQPIPQAVRDKRGLLRYFTHIDNPEKAQYLREDIVAYGGFDIGDAYKPVGSEITRVLDEIEQFIYDNDLTEFASLAEAVRASEDPDWKYVFRQTSTGYFRTLMQSRHFRKKESEALAVRVVPPAIPHENPVSD